MKFIHLDAARGLASIIVVLSHYTQSFPPSFMSDLTDSSALPLWGWLLNGTAAVSFFFVLSGFVLTRKYFETPDLQILLRGALKRFPRLYLSCGISILLGYLVLNFGFERTMAAQVITGSDWLRSFTVDHLPHDPPLPSFLAFKQTFAVLLAPGNSYFNSNLWTMPYEFWGSLCCFLLAWVLVGLERLTLSIAIGTAVTLLLGVHVFHLSLPFGAELDLLGSSMIVGCLFALLDVRGHKPPPWAAFPLIVMGLLACAQFVPFWDKTGGALLLLGLIAFRTPPACLTGPTARRLGEYSFPLYLVHTVVILSAGTLVFTQMHGWGLGDIWIDATTLITIFAVSLGLCWGIVRVERWWVPFLNRLSKAIIK